MTLIILWIVIGLILGILVDIQISKDDPILIRICTIMLSVLLLPLVLVAISVVGPIFLLIKVVDYIRS